MLSTHAMDRYAPEARGRRRGIGICLSGGGYRAALFHLGALRRLNELGVLCHPELRTVSSVSGGSIASAHLASALEWPLARPAPDWEERVEKPLRRFTARNIRTGPILARLLPWNWLRESTAVETIAARYEKDLTARRLRDLPEQPRFVLCATDMAFGVNWIFTRSEMGDYLAGYVRPVPAEWPLGRAVAASSCFPPVFNPLPVRFPPDAYADGMARAENEATWREAISDLRLTDGGNYDNMGLEPVWKDHAVVLVSDAGGLFDFRSDQRLLWRIKRYQSIQENQARALRKRWLISNFLSGQMEGAYWGITSARSSYEPADTVGFSKRIAVEVISEIRTDLDAFSEVEAAVLENHGYLLADVAVRKHAPSILPSSVPEAAPPHPEWLPPRADEAAIRRVLAESGKLRILGRS